MRVTGISEAGNGRGAVGRLLTAIGGSLLALLASCGGESSGRQVASSSQSCMQCHNGSPNSNDYIGPGIENPHPFPGADNILCTTCHGGNPDGADKDESHIPPPPEIGDRQQWDNNAESYFNRLTLTGIDRYDDYDVDGQTYTAIDYLQFINPGDLRVVTRSRGCGQCHQDHAECVNKSVLATSAGIFSGAMHAAGVDNKIPAQENLYEGTAADLAFRATTDPNFSVGSASVGGVGELLEFPVYSARDSQDANDIVDNQAFIAANLVDDRNSDNSLVTGSELAKLYHEQVAFTCGDCHLGSAGANNRYGDYRSSGCTACHMPYSQSGRSGSGDPNIDPNEPLDPDDIDDPELSHIRRHMILSVAKTLPSGEFVPGIDDYSCAGCHQGSNRTVMQYWGIRLDQNQDVRRRHQYPANPASFTTTSGDTRLFDPVVGNNEFNGRNRNQYLLEEDYDGDGLDDTPPDIHYEAGLGCIDCHGSFDLHGGDVNGGGGGEMLSRMEQAVAIRCESCHGDAENYAPTTQGTNYDGQSVELAVDAKGIPLRHVEVDAQGDYYLTSRLTGQRHYVVQTRDVVVDSGKLNPLTGDEVYSEKASYAMGRADGSPATGIGPQQQGGTLNGFSHGDNMSCASCHAAWTNNCIGCHLEGEYRRNQNEFSNITGERIVFNEDNADFVYQSPVFFQLGIGTDDKIAVIAPNTDTFFSYRDLNNNDSQVFAFSDRNGQGNNQLTTQYPSLAHNVMMPHSIRGKVDGNYEGPRYCVSCHLTDEAITNFGTEYDTFRTALQTGDFASLDFNLLKTHIGENPGNQLNSPFFVHMAAGLGTGLFLFDEHGCPVNPLDDDDDRVGCDGVAPADSFDVGRVVLDLDRIVLENGDSTGSNNHPMQNGASTLRDGNDTGLAGPLGADTIETMTDPNTGVVLDSWLDADGDTGGNASDYVGSGS